MMEEKIISVNAEGDICFEDEVLLREYVAEEMHKIVKLPSADPTQKDDLFNEWLFD